MNQLVFIENNRPVTDSLAVAHSFEKEHRRVMQDIRELQCSEEFRMHHFVQSEYINEQGRKMPRIIMSEQGFTILAMGYTGPKAMVFKEQYIAEFHRMRNRIAQAPSDPQQLIALALVEAHKIIEGKDRMIALMQPKAEFFDAVADSRDAIDIGTVAKVLGIPGVGRNNLFEILRKKGVLMSNNQPYQKYVDNGYFRIVEQKYTKPDGSTHINIKTLVFQKGLDFIRRIVTKTSA